VPVLCLSPTPLAAARAARRLCDAQGGILLGEAVTTLPRLVPAVLAASGDRRPVLPALAERLLALQAGADAGGPLAGLSPGAGLAGSLWRALAELRRGQVAPRDLRQAASSLEGAPAARLALLSAALEAYEERLVGLEALDGAGATRAAAEVVRRGAPPVAGGIDLLVLDGLSAASPAEWDLLSALVARAGRTRAILPYFPERPDLSAPAEPFLRGLESLHELTAVRDVEVVLPRLDDRAPRLAAVLAAVGGGPADRPSGGAGLVLAAPGAGEAGEVEAAADAVLRLLDRGLSPEEVVLISPSPRRAAGPLRAALSARGVALAAGRGLSPTEVPLVGLLREAIAAGGRLNRTAAARLGSSSWLSPDGAAGLDGLLERAGAVEGRGPAAAALRRRAASLAGGKRGGERARLLREADRLEGLEAALAPLARTAPAGEHARHLSAAMGRLGLRRRAARGPLEVAARDLAALTAVEAAAEEVVRAAELSGRAAASIPPSWFEELLGQVLDSSALTPHGEPAAGAVELLGPEDVAGSPARAAVLLGCAEGGFPAPPAPEALLRDPERVALRRQLRRPAVAASAARRAEALHRALVLFGAGTEALVFAWAARGPAGDGGPPAPLIQEALAAAGVEPPAGAPAEPPLAAAPTARAALRAAARLGPAGAAALRGTALHGRAQDAAARGEAEAARRAAALSGAPAPFAGAVEGPALAVLRSALPGEWSPSQLEAHARCPFHAFLRVAVGLPDAAQPDLDMEVRDQGTLLHALLERFVSARMARGAWPPRGDAADLAEARALAGEELGRFERQGRTGDAAAWAGRREAILHQLDRIVRAEARDHGGLTPRLIEHSFGTGQAAPALELAFGGELVRLRGRIDRVDAGPDRLLVIDYKNSRGGAGREDELDPEAFGTGSFQVPAYLMVAARELPGRRLEATLALLREPERLPPVALDPSDPRLAPAGGAFAAAVVAQVGEMRAGRFPVVSQGCERCPWGAVCRFEGLAARAASEGSR